MNEKCQNRILENDLFSILLFRAKYLVQPIFSWYPCGPRSQAAAAAAARD